MNLRTPPIQTGLWRSGWLDGVIGMLIFSASLPATRVAVLQIDALFLGFARAAIAGLCGLVLLRLGREIRPGRAELVPLAIVALGVVLGFPILTALALRSIPSAHALVFVGLLPLATAVCAVLRAHERPAASFWLFAVLGGALVAGYALSHSSRGDLMADGMMVVAVAFCGLGYAEGARLARTYGGWQVICWALVLALPLTAPASLILMPAQWAGIGWPAWAGFAYVSLFSMLIGFVFWYRGLAAGGIAAVGQLALVQPFFGLLLAAWLLQEPVGWDLVAVLTAVIGCVVGARRYA